MYQIFKYVAEHRMNIDISYNHVEDLVRISVSKDTPDRHYKACQVIFGLGNYIREPNQIIFNTVAGLVEQIERKVENGSD